MAAKAKDETDREMWNLDRIGEGEMIVTNDNFEPDNLQNAFPKEE